MKVHELLENKDDDLGAFRKDLLNNVKARVEYGKLLAKQHKWLHEVGDVLYSKTTGKTYTLTGQMMRPGRKDPATGEKKWIAVYFYKTNDGEEGTFEEPRMLQFNTLKNLTRPFTKES